MEKPIGFEFLTEVFAPKVEKCLTVRVAGTRMVLTNNCYCCSAPLQAVCVISADDTPARVRFGQCPRCGFATFMDHPDPEWLENYYNTQWDTQKIPALSELRDSGKRTIVDIVEGLGLSKDARIFEVGAGYGDQLRVLAKHGYKNIFGNEHSPHRADLAARFSGAHVVRGVFGTDSFSEEVKKYGPFDFIYSRSVIEHMSDPNLMYRGATALQDDGGILMYSMPYFPFESAMSALFFIAHVHGFSKRSCVELSRKNGYTAIDALSVKSMRMVARKGAPRAGETEYGLLEDPTEFNAQVREKWRKELRLAELTDDRPRIFWWCTAYTDFIVKSGTLPWLKNAFLHRLLFPALRVIFSTNVGGLFLRLIFKISRKHVAVIWKKWTPPSSEDAAPFNVRMKRLGLLYY